MEAPSIATILELPALSLARFKRLTTAEYRGAPPAVADPPFPVILYSHGYWLYAAQNTALMEHLASHGYVVFNLAHEGDSAAVAYADGSIGQTAAYTGPAGASDAGERLFWGGRTYDIRTQAIPVYRAETEHDRIGASFHAWRADTEFVLQAIDSRQLPAAVADLLPEIDPARLGLAGMSFGGSVAASICRTDAPCGAALNIDGDEFDFDLYNADYPRPLLLLCSDWVRHPYLRHQVHDASYHFDDYAYEQWENAGLSPAVYRIAVRGIRHIGFTDLILSMNRPLRDHTFGEIDGHEAISLVNDFALDFFDRNLKQQRLDFPQAELARHPAAYRRTAAEVREWWHGRRHGHRSGPGPSGR